MNEMALLVVGLGAAMMVCFVPQIVTHLGRRAIAWERVKYRRWRTAVRSAQKLGDLDRADVLLDLGPDRYFSSRRNRLWRWWRQESAEPRRR